MRHEILSRIIWRNFRLIGFNIGSGNRGTEFIGPDNSRSRDGKLNLDRSENWEVCQYSYYQLSYYRNWTISEFNDYEEDNISQYFIGVELTVSNILNFINDSKNKNVWVTTIKHSLRVPPLAITPCLNPLTHFDLSIVHQIDHHLIRGSYNYKDTY